MFIKLRMTPDGRFQMEINEESYGPRFDSREEAYELAKHYIFVSNCSIEEYVQGSDELRWNGETTV